MFEQSVIQTTKLSDDSSTNALSGLTVAAFKKPKPPGREWQQKKKLSDDSSTSHAKRVKLPDGSSVQRVQTS